MPRQTLCLPGILVAAALISIGNQAFARMGEPQSCEALVSLQITADALRLPTGGVTLTEVVHVAAAARTTDEETGEAVLELPVHRQLFLGEGIPMVDCGTNEPWFRETPDARCAL